MQQNAINAKGACKSYADKDAFDQKSQAQKDADRASASRIQKSYTASYQLANPGVDTSSMAALHRLDMVAGGSYNDIGGMGDRAINSSIGPEWTAESRGGKPRKCVKTNAR
jgi:Novel toxin 15